MQLLLAVAAACVFVNAQASPTCSWSACANSGSVCTGTTTWSGLTTRSGAAWDWNFCGLAWEERYECCEPVEPDCSWSACAASESVCTGAGLAWSGLTTRSAAAWDWNFCGWAWESKYECCEVFVTCPNANWDVTSDCTVCRYGWTEAFNCLACDNEQIDPASNCMSCKNPNFVMDDGCQGMCRNENYDEGSGCVDCLYGWDESSACLACENEDIDPLTNCTTCKFTSFSMNDGCQGTCFNGNYEASSGAMGCGFCKAGYAEGSMCTTCRNSWDPAADCGACLSGFDMTTDCAEEMCECGAEIGSCQVGGTGPVTQIWNVTLVPGTLAYNDTNFTLSGCADGVQPEDIYRHLSCVRGDPTFEGIRRAFECSAAWLRAGPDLSDLPRATSYLFDGLVEVSTAIALDELVDLDGRLKAAQLAATWQVARQMGRGLAYEFRYPNLRDTASLDTVFPPPPPSMPFGTAYGDREAQLGAALQAYLELFSGSGVVDMCKDWFRGFGQCECGLRFSGGRCTAMSEATLANVYTAHMYCSLTDGVIGTSASVELLQRTAQCVQREIWKSLDHLTLIGLLKLARATAAASAAHPLAASNGVRETLREVQADLSELVEPLARDMSTMRALDGRSIARIEAAESTDELTGVTINAVGRQIILQSIDENAAAIGEYVNNVADDISAQMQANFQLTTRSLEGLGDLVISATNLSITTSQAGFTALATAQQSGVLGELADTIAARASLQGKFLDSQIAITFDADQVSLALGRLTPFGNEIGAATQDFYECKRNQELAALARARAFAIFDVVVGAVQIVAEAALMVGTGGGSVAAKGAAKAGTKALLKKVGKSAAELITNDAVVSLARNGLEQFQDTAYGPDPSDPEARRRTGADALVAVMGETFREEVEDLRDGGLPVLTGDPVHDTPVETAVGVLDALDSAGVPFAGGAAQILAGAKVLADYNGAKDEIKAEYRANMAKSKAALEKLGELASKFGDFSAQMMLEFGQLVQLRVPARSAIESKSSSFWRAVQLLIIEFAKSTDMYQDFRREARRRALEEAPWGEHRQLLDSLQRFDPQVWREAAAAPAAAGGGVRGLLQARASADTGAVVETTDMRRALDSKKEDCNLGDKARRGLTAFDTYFRELDKVVFFCEALHNNLANFMTLVRDLIFMDSRITSLRQLNATYADAIAGINTPSSELQAFGAAFQQVLQRSYQRAAPEITSFKPEAFKRTAELQDDFLWEVCNAARYRFLTTPPSCNFRMANVVRSAKPSDTPVRALSDFLDDVLDEMQELGRDFRPVTTWVRMPVASTLGIRSAIAVNSSITADSVFSFVFDAPPEVMADAACGYNHEVEAYAFVLESRSGGAGLHPAALEDWYAYKLELAGPFVKLNAAGHRHVFEPLQAPSDLGSRIARVMGDGDDDCGEPGFATETFIIRRDQHRVCASKQNAESFGVSPVTPWGTNFSLTLMDLAPLVANEDLDLELVMYTQLRGLDMLPACEATQFASRQVVGAGGAQEEGAGAGVIVGASLAAVAFAAAGAFAAKKYLATRAAQTAISGKAIATANPLAEL